MTEVARARAFGGASDPWPSSASPPAGPGGSAAAAPRPGWPEGVILRPARAFDATPCAAIVNAWIDATPWLPRVHGPGEVARRYRHAFPQRAVTVAEVDGEVAGFLMLAPATGEVVSLFVALRRRGIGAALLDAARGGRGRLSLWTFAANTGARRFYRREGFREARRTDGGNEEGLPDVEYVWNRDGARTE